MNTPTPTPDPTPVDRAALRRQLAEALWARAQQDIVAEWICCDPVDQTHHLCVQGAATLSMVKSLIFDGPVTLADAVLDTVAPAAVDRAALRQRIAEALAREDAHNAGYDHGFAASYGADEETDGFVDAVLDAVLPAPADRAAVLLEAAEDLATAFGDPMVTHIGQLGAAHLRHRAREIQAAQTAEARPETPLEKRLRYSERRNDELRAECKRRGKIKLEQAEKIQALEREIDGIQLQLGAEILRANMAEDELRRLAAEAPQTETPPTVLLAAADRAEQTQNGDCRCSWCETCCGGCTGCACHHIAAELRRTAAAQPATPDTGDGEERPEDTARRFARRLYAVERLCSGRPGYHRLTVKQVLTAMSDSDPDDADAEPAEHPTTPETEA